MIETMAPVQRWDGIVRKARDWNELRRVRLSFSLTPCEQLRLRCASLCVLALLAINVEQFRWQGIPGHFSWPHTLI